MRPALPGHGGRGPPGPSARPVLTRPVVTAAARIREKAQARPCLSGRILHVARAAPDGPTGAERRLLIPSIRLDSFKSFADETRRLGPFSVIVGVRPAGPPPRSWPSPCTGAGLPEARKQKGRRPFAGAGL